MKKIRAAIVAIAVSAFLLCLAAPAWGFEPTDASGPEAVNASAPDDDSNTVDAPEPAGNSVDGALRSAPNDADGVNDMDDTDSASLATPGDNSTLLVAPGGATGITLLAAPDNIGNAATDAKSKEDSHVVTFNGNGHGIGVLYTVEVPAESTVWDAIRSMPGGILEWQKIVFIEIEDAGKLYRTSRYALDPAGTQIVWPQGDFDNTIDEDVPLYAVWDTCITEVELTIVPPLCGTKVNTKFVDGEMPYWDFSTQVENPVVSIAPGSEAHYTLDLDGYYSELDKRGVPIALNKVTLEGGVAYNVFVSLSPSMDYYFSKKGPAVKINGATVTGVDATTTAAQAYAFVVAVHDWGEWAITKEPTYTTEGEKTRVCKANSSHVEHEPLPVLQPPRNGGSSAGEGATMPATGDPFDALAAMLAALAVVSGCCLAMCRKPLR